MQLYLQIYWVSAKTGFDKRRRWSQSFPLPNFSVKVLVVEAGDFPYIFPDYSNQVSTEAACNGQIGGGPETPFFLLLGIGKERRFLPLVTRSPAT